MEALVVLMFASVIGSIILRLYRQLYHSAEEGTDTRIADQYGHPVKSLYTSTQLFTLHHKIEITDGSGKLAYRVETQFPSIHDKTDIYRADGKHVAHIERKLLSLHEVRYIEMDKGRDFQLSNELFHIIRDVTNIEGLGWILEGNLLQLNFTLKDSSGRLIAVAGQKVMSIHDKYSLDLYRPEYEEETVAILIALQHMIRDREAASSSGGGAGAGSGN